MINPASKSTSMFGNRRAASREIQLFEPQPDAVYTIEATSRIVDIPRRTILLYCKYQLLSPAMDSADHGYCFDGDAIRALRCIEALRAVCGDDFAGIRIILELTAALERLRSDLNLLSRRRNVRATKNSARDVSPISSRKINLKSNSRRKSK
jgi:DNA-binding transcriptional MerR regulator